MKWQVTLKKSSGKLITKNVHPGDHGSFTVEEGGKGKRIEGHAFITKAGENAGTSIVSCEKYAGRFG
jgi:hypothetical protein